MKNKIYRNSQSIKLIGAPLDLGSERLGVDMAPNALRYQNFTQNLFDAGLDIEDLGNIYCPSSEEVRKGNKKAKYIYSIAEVCKELALVVKKNAESGSKQIVLGGDHSIAIGSVSGAKSGLSGSLGLIWIDAHGDLNTPETTPSGNIHGMPLAALLGYGDKILVNLLEKGPIIEGENLLAIGLKDLDWGEKELIKEKKLNTVMLNDILAGGLNSVFTKISDMFESADNVWVSVDLDAVDSDEAPGVGMPNKGGLTYREISAIAEHIGKHEKVVGIDIVEYNPVNDIFGKTARLATEIAAKVFGKEYSNYTEYLKKHGI